MINHYRMLIEWSSADDAYVVSFPEFLGAHTHGATHREAAKNGRDPSQESVGGKSDCRFVWRQNLHDGYRRLKISSAIGRSNAMDRNVELWKWFYDQELQVTKERIDQFQRWLAQMRRTARLEEFAALTGGYRLEIERMQAEVLEYLLCPLPVDHEPEMV
jgi:hypothetical protein